jgi:hypothetical protein
MSIFHWGNLATTGLVWYLIGIAPFSNIRKNNQEIAPRFSYVSNIGIMVFLASVIYHYPLLIGLFIGIYAARLFTVMDMYKDDYWVIEYAVIEDPHAWYAWHIRGHKRWDVGSYKEAMIMWVMAKMISPREFKVLYNIAVALRVLHNIKESDDFIKAAEENIIEGQETQAREVIAALKNGRCPLLV